MKRIIYCILAALTCLCFFACCKDNSETSSSEAQKNSIEFVLNEISLSVGETVQAEVITSKNNVFVFWSMRDENVATISDSGMITAVAEGQTICYATFGGETAMCLIKVSPATVDPMLSISVPYNQDNLTLYVGDSIDLRASVKLGDAVVEGATISCVTDNESVITVEGETITACGVGSVTVTISATYQEQMASITLTITAVEK